MKYVYAIHGPETQKLAFVKAIMGEVGAPTIKVVNCTDYYMALEGSHRLAAAHALKITPVFEVYEQDDLLKIESFDWYDECNWAETEYTAGEVAGELFSSGCKAYDFNFEAQDE